MRCESGYSNLEIKNALSYNHFTFILGNQSLGFFFLPADLEKRQAKHPSKSEHSALAYGYAHRVAEGAG